MLNNNVRNLIALFLTAALSLVLVVGCGDENHYYYEGEPGTVSAGSPRPSEECGCPMVEIDREYQLSLELAFSCKPSTSANLQHLEVALCEGVVGVITIPAGSGGLLKVRPPAGYSLMLDINGHLFPNNDEEELHFAASDFDTEIQVYYPD